jgi:bacillithiol system protein YtxJ
LKKNRISKNWINKQKRDIYVRQSQVDGYRARSAYKLIEIDEKSIKKKQVLFKHSTRCSVSSFAKRVLTNEYSEEVKQEADVYYLDLIAFREISNLIASRYNVHHESPQILVIEEGKCIFNASHSDVSFKRILSN